VADIFLEEASNHARAAAAARGATTSRELPRTNWQGKTGLYRLDRTTTSC
jgi:hypothetical protein